jgi:hypothetical protein
VKIVVERLANLVVDHPLVATLLLVLVTGVATLGHVDPDWLERMTAQSQAAPEQMEASGDTSRKLPDVEPIQVGRGDVVLVVEADDFFTLMRCGLPWRRSRRCRRCRACFGWTALR